MRNQGFALISRSWLLAYDVLINKGGFMKKFLVIILAAQIGGLVGCASTPRRSDTVYTTYRDTPTYHSQPVYVQPSPQPVYAQSQPSSQDEYNKKIIKQGLLGAATGALASGASGGKAGTGALIGAGTNIIGGALLDYLTTQRSQSQQTQYAPYVNQWNQQNPNTNRIVRKFDSNGNVISEEVFTR